MAVNERNEYQYFRRNLNSIEYSHFREISRNIPSTAVTFTAKFEKLEKTYLTYIMNYHFKNDSNRPMIFGYKLEFLVFNHNKSDEKEKLYADTQSRYVVKANEVINMISPLLDLSHYIVDCNRINVGIIFESHSHTEDNDPYTTTETAQIIGNKFLQASVSMYNDDDLKDLKFVIGNETLLAHKFVVASRSKVFHLMLTHDMKEKNESIIDIKDTNIVAFQSFLKYLYTNEIDKLKEYAEDLIMLADKYDVQCLKKICEDYMCKNVNRKNSLLYLITAHLSNSKLLKVTALAEMKPHIKDILQSRDGDLLDDYPMLLKDIVYLMNEDSH